LYCIVLWECQLQGGNVVAILTLYCFDVVVVLAEARKIRLGVWTGGKGVVLLLPSCTFSFLKRGDGLL
jgi:hypothetical protein